MRSVGVFLLPVRRRIQFLGTGEKHGRGMNDGRIDETVKGKRIVAEMAKPRVDASRFEDVFLACAHCVNYRSRRTRSRRTPAIMPELMPAGAKEVTAGIREPTFGDPPGPGQPRSGKTAPRLPPIVQKRNFHER